MQTKPKPPTEAQAKRRPVHNVAKIGESSTPKRLVVNSGTNVVPGLDFSMFGDMSGKTVVYNGDIGGEQDIVDNDRVEEREEKVVIRPTSSRKHVVKKAKQEEEEDGFAGLLDDWKVEKESGVSMIKEEPNEGIDEDEDQFISDQGIDLQAMMSARLDADQSREAPVQVKREEVPIVAKQKQSNTREIPGVLDLDALKNVKSVSAENVARVTGPISSNSPPTVEKKRDVLFHCHPALISLQNPVPSSLVDGALPMVRQRADMTRGIQLALLVSAELNPHRLPLQIVQQSQVLGLLTQKAYIQHQLSRLHSAGVAYRAAAVASSNMDSVLLSYLSEQITDTTLPSLDVALTIDAHETMAAVLDSLSRSSLLLSTHTGSSKSKLLNSFTCVPAPAHVSSGMACFREYSALEYCGVITAANAQMYLQNLPTLDQPFLKDQFLDLGDYKDVTVNELYTAGKKHLLQYLPQIIQLVRSLTPTPNTIRPAYVRDCTPADTAAFRETLSRVSVGLDDELFAELFVDKMMALEMPIAGGAVAVATPEWSVAMGMEILTTNGPYLQCVDKYLSWTDFANLLDQVFPYATKRIRDEAAIEVRGNTTVVANDMMSMFTPTELALQSCLGVISDASSKLSTILVYHVGNVQSSSFTIVHPSEELDTLYSLLHCTRTAASILLVYIQSKNQDPMSIFKSHKTAVIERIAAKQAKLKQREEAKVAAAKESTLYGDANASLEKTRDTLSTLDVFLKELHEKGTAVVDPRIQSMVDSARKNIKSIEDQFPLFDDDYDDEHAYSSDDEEEEHTIDEIEETI